MLAELLPRLMGSVIPFSLDDLRALADSVRSPDLRIRLEEVSDFDAGRIVFSEAEIHGLPPCNGAAPPGENMEEADPIWRG